MFHAGTKLEKEKLLTSGGRVLNMVAQGTTLAEAIDKAYKAVEQVNFDKMICRSDIGKKGLSS